MCVKLFPEDLNPDSNNPYHANIYICKVITTSRVGDDW